MKYKLILNACSACMPARAKELYAFTLGNISPLEAEAGETIIIHDGRTDRQDLLDSTFSGRVVLLKLDGPCAETALKVLPDLCRDADLLLFPGDYLGEELAVRLACRLGGGSLVSADSLKVDGGQFVFGKKVYSQHLKAFFKMTKKPACVSIARGGAESDFTPRGHVEFQEIDCSGLKPDFLISSRLKTAEKADTLALARRLVVAGLGVGSREELERLEEFSQAIGARLGVSRPVAMNAWAPLNKLVGVSGTMARPDWCITFGVSGAEAFYAGIEKSAFIISVNHDGKAPIIRKSDVAVIDDCVAVREELRKLLSVKQ